MPKLIDYPRTNYTGAWELAEVVDDTGGKCAIDTAARKLNRKVSGSFKAIIGSAVKFGLMTSKRELLSTTTLFKRIKHAYDKQEELQFHREAFLTPPLFTQICRKFRGRELPVQMLDVMLIREFGVEEINAQGVAKAFVEGCHMCGILDNHNIMADIDALNAQRPPRRELASSPLTTNAFTQSITTQESSDRPNPTDNTQENTRNQDNTIIPTTNSPQLEQLFGATISPLKESPPATGKDLIADLFGLTENAGTNHYAETRPGTASETESTATHTNSPSQPLPSTPPIPVIEKQERAPGSFHIEITGPGVNTSLDITHEEDITIAVALLEKIRRQLHSEK